jgi:hypothetical protein
MSASSIVPPTHSELIASRIPIWLHTATAPARATYQNSLHASLASGAKARAIARRFNTPAVFCEPLLDNALQDEFNLAVPVDATELVRMRREYFLDRLRLAPHRQTLLAAAMANFEADEAFEQGSMILPQGDFKLVIRESVGYVHDPARVLPISAQQFADTCRRLDLGARYQAHVREVFQSPWAIESLKASLADEFRVQVRRAALRDKRVAELQQALLGLLDDPPVQRHGRPLEICQLRALATWVHSGSALSHILLIRQQGAADSPCVVYMPGEPDQPIKSYGHFSEFSDVLRERLRSDAYRGYFERFVGETDKPAFFERLINTLSPRPISLLFPQEPVPDPGADIGLRCDVIAGALGQWLYDDRLARIAADASAFVVPTGVEDQKTRDKRLQRYLEAGLVLANAAAFVVPGVGALMAVVGVTQLLGEVFVGIDDWTHGQTEEAMAHFFDVAGNVALIAATASAGVAINRSVFVEGMLPVLDSSGTTRLWHGTLEAFASDEPLPDGLHPNDLGQYRFLGKDYIRIEGRMYHKRWDLKQQHWYLQHPDPQLDYRLALEHNGQGAWRGAHEDPRQWSSLQAMRRLGPVVEGLDDLTLEQARQASGVSDAVVHRLHTESRPLPAALQDCLADIRAAQQISDLPAPEQAAAFARLRDEPLVAAQPTFALRRDFKGLTRAAAQEILAQANDRERVQLLEHQRVPLRLAEQARMAVRETQLNRACLGLLLPGVADAERLRTGLEALASPARIQPQQLFELAVQDRARAARLLGQRRTQAWLRPPTRQANGLIGYALSGRPQPAPNDAQRARLRLLYPQADELLLARLLNEMRPAVELNLALREREYQRLHARLNLWAREPATIVAGNDLTVVVRRESRDAVMQSILRVWRREGAPMDSARGRGQGFELDLSGHRVGALPTLEARFDHVHSLNLELTGQVEDPSAFLMAFRRLETLELQHNFLSRIPTAVGFMPDLNALVLQGNRLVGSPGMFDMLVNLNDLQMLILRGNQAQIPGPAMQVLGGLRSLTDLALDATATPFLARDLQQLARLPWLSNLSLANNGLVLTAEHLQAFNRMASLEMLELDRNPLGPELDVRALRHLRALSLRHCNLTQWPPGLDVLMNAEPLNLRRVALEHNPISEVPVLRGLAFFARSRVLGSRLEISADGLSEQSRQRLQTVGVEPLVSEEPEDEQAAPDWMIDCPEPLRAHVDTLRADPRADLFMEALDQSDETEDYRRDPEIGRQRVQNLIRAICEPVDGDDGQGLAHLRRQVFAVGEEALTTCGDGIQLILNRCETLVLVYQAAGIAGLPGEAMAPLVHLSRQLYRADVLDLTAVRIIQRRIERRAALFPEAAERRALATELALVTARVERGAPVLDPLDDATTEQLMALPDEAELRLRFRVDLAHDLDLPPQPAYMRYYQEVSDGLMARVSAYIPTLDSDIRWLQWVVEQGWWRDCLIRRDAERFDQLSRHWYAGHEYLFELGRAQPEIGAVPRDVLTVLEGLFGDRTWQVDGVAQAVALTEAERDTAIQHLRAAERRAQTELIQVLSQQVLDRSRAV